MLLFVIQVTVLVVTMKFYNRENELETLNEIYQQCCKSYGKITVLTGRRRIGKTLLAQKYASDKESIYDSPAKRLKIPYF